MPWSTSALNPALMVHMKQQHYRFDSRHPLLCCAGQLASGCLCGTPRSDVIAMEVMLYERDMAAAVSIGGFITQQQQRP